MMMNSEITTDVTARFKRLVLLALGLILMSGSVFSKSLRWDEAPQFVIKVNGKTDISARAFQPEGSKPFMILESKQFKSPLLIDLGKKKVFRLKSSDLKPDGDYALVTKGIPTGSILGEYIFSKGASRFKYSGKSVSIRFKQSLVGKVSKAIILAHSPEYVMLRDSYKAKKSVIRALKKYRKKTHIVVLFATWCPTCKVVLPQFFRIMKDAGNSAFSYEYFGIAMGGSEPFHVLEKYGHDSPSIIFYQNGKEIGRIIGEPPGKLEDSILSYLK